MSADKSSTGDGMGSGVGAGSQSVADRGANISQMIKTIGVPGKMRQSQFQSKLGQIYAKFGARTAEQKEQVCESITLIAIGHGCGPNVKWEDVECPVQGCKTLMMNEIVDAIIGRDMHRRFMVNFSERALSMCDASLELQNILTARAVRNGIPITEKRAVIDFLDPSTGVSPAVLEYRNAAKYSAVARANQQQPTSLQRSSRRAANVMHGYMDDEGDSIGEV